MAKSINILLVEDEFLNRLYTNNTLISFGYSSIYEAGSVEEALDIIQSNRIDFAILDINLGADQKDGIFLGKEISEKYHFPFIYLTAYGTRQMFEKAKVNNPQNFLIKPFSEVELLAAIELALDKYQASDLTPINDYLLVKTGTTCIKLPIKEIIYIESEGNYLKIYTETGEFKYRNTIKMIMQRFINQGFIQVHRGFVLNKSKISKTLSDKVILGEVLVPLSKKYKINLS